MQSHWESPAPGVPDSQELAPFTGSGRRKTRPKPVAMAPYARDFTPAPALFLKGAYPEAIAAKIGLRRVARRPAPGYNGPRHEKKAANALLYRSPGIGSGGRFFLRFFGPAAVKSDTTGRRLNSG